jgi:GR25 family glycosyltransferase involved in LPS biosynthesis
MENTLNDFFDKIYLINLDSRKDRLNECEQEFLKHKMSVHRVPAIDGSKTFKAGMNRNSGNHGLLLTNIAIYEDAIKNGCNNILILEDDVMFLDNLNKIFFEKIKFLPDNWDLLYLGGSHIFDKGNFTSISKKINEPINRNTYKSLNNELCKTTWTQTTHAVGINGKKLKNYLDVLKNSRKPIDMIYCNIQQNELSNVYTFLPSIAVQRPSFSDIENVVVDYSKNKRWTF